MATYAPSADWQRKILKKEYQNWLAVGHALSLMLDGLRPYIEREIKAFHQALLTNLAEVPRCTCPTPTKHSCAWAAQLVGWHKGGKPSSPKWRQSDSSAWTDPHRGEWEVAKLFMSDLGTSKTTVVDANTTDCTGLINLMFWCVHFPIQRHVIAAVRETRNTKWGHAPRQELTDSERADALTAIRDLLQDPELIADGDAKTALNEITLMEANFDAQSVERKVLADFQVAVLGQLGDIEGELKNVNRCCKKQQNNSNKIRKKLGGLEEQQKKAIELLQSIQDRIDDVERRNISSYTLTWRKIEWTLKKTKRGFVVNLCSLSTRSLSFWMFLVILLGYFKCLNHNSYNDGKFHYCPTKKTVN